MALVTGAWNLLLPKGTPLHRRAGRLYVAAMLIANLGILAVYRFDIASFRPFRGGPGIFGIFHWEAVTTLALLALAVYAAPRQRRAVWAYIHPIAMLLTYYILVGGLINEMFVRVTVLRAMVGSGRSFFASPIVGLTQSAAMLLFIVMLVYFVVRVALWRSKPATAQPT